MREPAAAPARPRTVLVLHRGGAQIRGTEEALLGLLAGIDLAAFRPVVLCSDRVLVAPLERLGAEARRQGFPEILVSRRPQLPIGRWLRAAREIANFARERDAGAILCNGGGPCQLGVPVGRRLGVPVVCWMHHPAPRYLHRAWLTRFATSFVFSSAFTAEHTRERIGRTGTIAYPGTDARGRYRPPRERNPEPRRMLGIAPDDVVFAQLGALVEHKEHALLLEAFARVAREMAGARLLIVGAGPEEARLREIAAARGIGARVTFTGYVDDPAYWLRHVADAHVLASREEGLGLATLQASACALPTIGGDGTGVRETILPGRTGFLFPIGDAEALSERMLRLARDPVLRAAMGRAGREMVLERFSPEACRASFESTLHAVLSAAPEAAIRTSTPAEEPCHA